MAVEIQKIYIDHPQPRLIQYAADILRKGGLVVYPTDTIYGLGADLVSREAMDRIYRLKKTSNHKLLSFICADLKDIAHWAQVSDLAYRNMRKVLPGQYTIILKATRNVPKTLLQNRKTVGIRVPAAVIPIRLVEALGRPILSTSVPQGSDGYYSDPEEIAEIYKHDIDLILDAGRMFNQPSTVVDFSAEVPEILRHGSGDPELLFF